MAISVDHIHAHRVFEASMGTLPYPLLSDWDKSIVKAYKVFNAKGGTAIRSVFVVNQEGILTYSNTSFKADNPEHYQAVFNELEKLSNTSKSNLWMNPETVSQQNEFLN